MSDLPRLLRLRRKFQHERVGNITAHPHERLVAKSVRESPSVAARSKLTMPTRPRRADRCVLRRDEHIPRHAGRLRVGAIRDPKGQGIRERRLCARELMACDGGVGNGGYGQWGVVRTRRNRATEIAGNYGLLVLLI